MSKNNDVRFCLKTENHQFKSIFEFMINYGKLFRNSLSKTELFVLLTVVFLIFEHIVAKEILEIRF